MEKEKIIILETKNYIVEVPKKPLVSREDGGHIKIIEKHNIEDRLLLEPTQAVELAWVTMLVGQAFITTMRKNGVAVERLNYHDMGNWCYIKKEKPHQHLHIFGRTFESKVQPLPNSLYLPLRSTGFYDNFKPLNENDINDLKTEINNLLNTEKFNPRNWKLDI